MSTKSERLVAIDWLRGFVMVLMAVDHSSAMFNAGRLAVDSRWAVEAFGVAGWEPGTALPAAQFWTRWITHLCAPTFLFLSGTSLALSTHAREARGMAAAAIDRHLVIRGLVLLGFEAAWLSLGPSALAGRYVLVLQVLYAIGVSLMAMALLRRLPSTALVALAFVWFAGGEWLTQSAAPFDAAATGPLAALLLAPGTFAFVAVAYPLIPWLAMMLLGWAFGSHLVRLRRDGVAASGVAPRCAIAGLASLALFAGVRAANGYGNLGLLRDGTAWSDWLHVSKYPPGLSFASLELGIMALCLAALLVLQGRLRAPANPNNLFLVLGRTALFFYVLHFAVLAVLAALSGVAGRAGLLHTYLAAALAILVLYPACRAYQRYKAAHPRSLAQYL